MMIGMKERRDLARAVPICVLLILGILAVYLPLRLDFITYDDPDYVTSNPHVRAGVTWESVEWALGHTSSAEWHPLTILSHMIDCQFYGLNSRGHHFTNLLLHAANSLILLFLLWSMTGRLLPSAFAAALFAFHPMNVEAVAWISERKGLLSTFFGLLCLFSYVRYAKASQGSCISGDTPASQPGNGPNIEIGAIATARKSIPAAYYYVLAFVFLGLGLLSKPMLVTWPFVMLLLDYWPLRRFSAANFKYQRTAFVRLVLEKIPFLALSLASCIVAFLVGRAWGAVTTAVETPLSARISNALLAYRLYIQKLIWPTHLSINYPFVLHWPTTQVLASLIGLVTITTLVVWQATKRPYLAVGWGWYVGTLVPVIGLLHFGNHFMADRYSYVTAIGLFILIGWTGGEFAGKSIFRRTIASICAGGVLMACALCAKHQLLYWQNSEALFRHAIAVNPNDFVAQNNLGFYFDQHRNPAQAEECYRAALAINPASTFALEKLATLLIAKNRNEEAAASCEAALSLEPLMPDAHCTLGLAYMKLGKRKEALAQYAEAISIRPDFAPAHYNMANALAAQGQFQEALEHYHQAVRWDPDNADAHNNLAYLLIRERRLDEAVPEFRAALRLKPDLWQAEYGLADVLDQQGSVIEAIDHFRKVLHARPDLPEALARLAWILATNPDSELRNGAEAVSLAERACTLTGYKQLGSLRALAAGYAEVGRFTDATDWAEKAQSLAAGAGQKEFSQRLQELADLFRSRQPYRQPRNMNGH